MLCADSIIHHVRVRSTWHWLPFDYDERATKVHHLSFCYRSINAGKKTIWSVEWGRKKQRKEKCSRTHSHQTSGHAILSVTVRFRKITIIQYILSSLLMPSIVSAVHIAVTLIGGCKQSQRMFGICFNCSGACSEWISNWALIPFVDTTSTNTNIHFHPMRCNEVKIVLLIK